MSRALSVDGERINPLVARFNDYLPAWELMPDLSDEQVRQFVELGEQGDEAVRRGDLEAAEAAFYRQLDIYRGNPDPFVALAFVEAGRVDRAIGKARRRAVGRAFEHLENAVLRGFDRLQTVREAEGWGAMAGIESVRLANLEDAARASRVVVARWARWDRFAVARTPASFDRVLQDHETALGNIDRLSPALGRIQTERWTILVDRVLAANLQKLTKTTDSESDLTRAFDLLVALYIGDRALTWTPLDPETAKLVDVASKNALANPSSAERPRALVARALAAYSARDRDGRLKPDALSVIRESLSDLVVDRKSPVFPLAAAGLIHTEARFGSSDEAVELFREVLDEESPGDTTQEVRRHLGLLALSLGGLPDFQGRTIDGAPIAVEDIGGNVAVFDFWATWCDPCKDEFPTLRKIADRFGDRIVIVAVNMDSSEPGDVGYIRDWIDRERVPGTHHVHDGLSFESPVASEFCVDQIPLTVVVGHDGKVLAINKKKKDLIHAVEKALQRATEDV